MVVAWPRRNAAIPGGETGEAEGGEAEAAVEAVGEARRHERAGGEGRRGESSEARHERAAPVREAPWGPAVA